MSTANQTPSNLLKKLQVEKNDSVLVVNAKTDKKQYNTDILYLGFFLSLSLSQVQVKTYID